MRRRSIISKADVITPIGQIFDSEFKSGSLSNYIVNNGAGTIAINSGDRIRMSGASGGITSNIQYNSSTNPNTITMLEHWKQRVKFIAATGSGANGFSIGVFSITANTKVHLYARLAQDTGNIGALYFYSNVNGSISQTNSTTFALTNGTQYWFEVERVKNLLTARIYAADGTTELKNSSRTNDITTLGFSNIASNIGKFCLINHGGTNDILEWNCSSTEGRNKDILHLGASNTYGMFSGSNSVRYAEQASTSAGRSFSMMTGFDNDSADLLLAYKQMLFLTPKRAMIHTIGNDIAHGVASNVWQQRYIDLVTYLKNDGVRVIHTTPIARDGFNNSIVLSFLQTQYPSDTVADLFTLSKAASTNDLNDTYDMGDGTHANPLGHNTFANYLKKFL